MTLVDNSYFVTERPHRSGGGVQRIYRAGMYGLSCVNAPLLHSYPFAWEVAVLRFKSPPAGQHRLYGVNRPQR